MKRMLVWGSLFFACVLPAAALAQVEVVVGPPPAFVATSEPVYYEGHPAYWWGGRWYWREAGAWRFYHDEPGYLRDWRGRRGPAHVYYGREHWREGRRR